MRLAPLVVVLMLAPAACDDPKSKPGAPCKSDGDCESGMCLCDHCDTPDGDGDTDGLSNVEETDLVKTDPCNPDTDGDGEADKREVNRPSAPLDCDGDGVIDAKESQLATELHGDADGDGVPDEWDAEDGPFCPDTHVPEPEGSDELGCQRWTCRELTHCELGEVAEEDTTCDGVDDDCDRLTDEDFVEAECTSPEPGRDKCAATLKCRDATVTCEWRKLSNLDRTCDGVNDDCDVSAEGQPPQNRIDEDYRPRSCGFGVCEGRTVCRRGETTCPTFDDLPQHPEDECDGLDDNCDGRIDENWVAGEDDVCHSGECQVDALCRAGQIVCPPLPDDIPVVDNACDGIDEDCDGEIDEEWPGFGHTPPPCGPEECPSPSECVAGEVVCQPSTADGDDPEGDQALPEEDGAPFDGSDYADLTGWTLSRRGDVLEVGLNVAGPVPVGAPAGRDYVSFEVCIDHVPDAGAEGPGPLAGCDTRVARRWTAEAGAWECLSLVLHPETAEWVEAPESVAVCARGARQVSMDVDLTRIIPPCGRAKLLIDERVLRGQDDEVLVRDTVGAFDEPGSPLP